MAGRRATGQAQADGDWRARDLVFTHAGPTQPLCSSAGCASPTGPPRGLSLPGQRQAAASPHGPAAGLGLCPGPGATQPPCPREARGEGVPARSASLSDRPLRFQNCFELYIPDSKDQVIKACKTEADGRVVEGNHTVYRISAPTPEEKEEWVKRIR